MLVLLVLAAVVVLLQRSRAGEAPKSLLSPADVEGHRSPPPPLLLDQPGDLVTMGSAVASSKVGLHVQSATATGWAPAPPRETLQHCLDSPPCSGVGLRNGCMVECRRHCSRAPPSSAADRCVSSR